MTTVGKNQRRIFLVDDHPLVREWLSNLINQEPDLVVCGETGEAASAVHAVAEARPDLVIMDLSLKNASGFDLIAEIRRAQPETQVMVLSMHEESVYAERALRSGARGYVMKQENSGRMTAAIRRVLEGGIYMSENLALAIAEKLVQNAEAKPKDIAGLLSDREMEIFRLLGGGRTTNQIAAQLHINAKTVQSYCGRIKEKLSLANGHELLLEAVRWCVHEGLPRSKDTLA